MKKGFIFDLDGTVYLGDEVIEGAAETIQLIKDKGDQVVFLSNNPANSRRTYQNKLRKMGIEADLEEIINSSFVTAKYLKQKLHSNEKVWVIGEAPLFEELQNHGVPITMDPTKAAYALVSWDRDFTYGKLNQAYVAWKNGAIFLATNPDRTCPTPNGQVPDCGAIIGAIEGATGEAIHHIIGKPSNIMARAAAEHLKLKMADCIMVGDRLETDIKMGNEVGMQTILVLTGITNSSTLNPAIATPTYIIKSIKEIPELEEVKIS
ncbi:HAD-IIA family hydrolase [Sutcliffiella rhizosphaerae]|uniref:Acid sugar phosphatase n=1 Tax=Sutcliffiella rhizosphaerae TaxID=2880967 RepID=A0ABN8ABX7_9BACI|nr:HAD-IIA family hydrolase [Sutcliffiella rhizosphaerae]CAG9621177.1 Sugar-phosphatase AraL [Sutcliffiella rhizosphaerae]